MATAARWAAKGSSPFHALLQSLSEEHDREVSSLLATVSELSSRVSCDPHAVWQADPYASPVGIPDEFPLQLHTLNFETEFARAQCADAVQAPAPATRNFMRQALHGGYPVFPEQDSDEMDFSTEAMRRMSAAMEVRRESAEIADTSIGSMIKEQLKTRKCFVDGEKMKETIREAACRPDYNVEDFYSTTGVYQAIARSVFFDRLTLAVIALNAVWMWYETDHNNQEVLMQAQPQFQLVEYSFCTFFSCELYIRFMAFRRWQDCCKDAWFVFDSFLVLFTMGETWAFTLYLIFSKSDAELGAQTSLLRMARLLRLTRMARMARLFRACPELLILIKGMLAAVRSVFFTLCLLLIIMYIFGIFFTQMVGEKLREEFGVVATSMHTLLIDGTLLDGTGDLVRLLWEIDFGYVVIFYLFVLLSALTVMNMLIGVLCEVVSAVASSEREGIAVGCLKNSLQQLWTQKSASGSYEQISKEEVMNMLGTLEMVRALETTGVDPMGLVDHLDYMFAMDAHEVLANGVNGEATDQTSERERLLSFEEFITLVLSLRGTNSATVKDMVDLRKHMNVLTQRTREEVRTLAKLTAATAKCFGLTPERSDESSKSRLRVSAQGSTTATKVYGLPAVRTFSSEVGCQTKLISL